jgi:hypothetical protein
MHMHRLGHRKMLCRSDVLLSELGEFGIDELRGGTCVECHVDEGSRGTAHAAQRCGGIVACNRGSSFLDNFGSSPVVGRERARAGFRERGKLASTFLVVRLA